MNRNGRRVLFCAGILLVNIALCQAYHDIKPFVEKGEFNKHVNLNLDFNVYAGYYSGASNYSNYKYGTYDDSSFEHRMVSVSFGFDYTLLKFWEFGIEIPADYYREVYTVTSLGSEYEAKKLGLEQLRLKSKLQFLDWHLSMAIGYEMYIPLRLPFMRKGVKKRYIGSNQTYSEEEFRLRSNELVIKGGAHIAATPEMLPISLYSSLYFSSLKPNFMKADLAFGVTASHLAEVLLGMGYYGPPNFSAQEEGKTIELFAAFDILLHEQFTVHTEFRKNIIGYVVDANRFITFAFTFRF